MTDHLHPSQDDSELDKSDADKAEIEPADHTSLLPVAIESSQASADVPLAEPEAARDSAPATEPLLAEPPSEKLDAAASLEALPDETTLSDENATNSVRLEPASPDATASNATALDAPPSDVPPTETPPDEPAVDEPSPETWEDDENPTTLFLRALFTLLAGGFLSWSQSQAVIDQGRDWNRWISLSVVDNFILPLGIIWMFFAQGLGHLDWLRDQKYNAWNYGWNFKQWRRHVKLALVMFAFMLPFLWFAARDPNTRAFYRSDATHYGYFPPVTGASSWLWLLLSLTIYMLCWEWFHRGFLLFGMAQGFGPVLAILLQAALFAAAHYHKPMPEFVSSFAGGLVLGAVAWREKSFVPAFLTHAFVHIAWAILVLS